jgi:hypothetical protein
MRRALGIALLVLGMAASSEAGPITLTDLPSVQFDYVYLGVEQGVFGMAGVQMSNGSGIDGAIDGRLFQAYCVDLDGPLPLFDQTVVDATAAPMTSWSDPSGLASPRGNAGAQTAWLYTEFVDEASPDAITRTALQVALWNVLYDVDFTVSEGLAPALFSVRVDDFQTQNDLDIIEAANGYLGALQANLVAANLADATWLQLRVLDCTGNNCDLQDFIGPGQEVNPVPEPATALLLATGAIGLVASRRRRTKT